MTHEFWRLLYDHVHIDPTTGEPYYVTNVVKDCPDRVVLDQRLASMRRSIDEGVVKNVREQHVRQTVLSEKKLT